MRKLLGSTILFFLLAPILVRAQLNSDASGLTSTGNAAYNITDVQSVGSFIGEFIIQPVLGITGLLFLLLTIYAGFLWMTAGGDPSRVKKAKDILLAAVIGTAIMALAYVITNAVINAVSSGYTTSL